MSTTSDQPLLPPSIDHDTVIRNIVQANGNEIIQDIDDFLEQEGINLGFDKLPTPVKPMDNDTLLNHLRTNDDVSQQTRLLVQSYFAKVETMKDLEAESTKALKGVEHAQVALENIIQGMENQKDGS